SASSSGPLMASFRFWRSAPRSRRSPSTSRSGSPRFRKWGGSLRCRSAWSSSTPAKGGGLGGLGIGFGCLNVLRVVRYMVGGLLRVAGIGHAPAVGLSNLFNVPGGFLPHGWRGVWLALTLVITSYMGVEVIAVTAGEAEQPETSIPRAMKSMVLRLIIFY